MAELFKLFSHTMVLKSVTLSQIKVDEMFEDKERSRPSIKIDRVTDQIRSIIIPFSGCGCQGN